jgi:hypothetical protein
MIMITESVAIAAITTDNTESDSGFVDEVEAWLVK